MYKGAIYETFESIKRYLKTRKERIAAEQQLNQLKEKEKKRKEFEELKRKIENERINAQKEDEKLLNRFRNQLETLTNEKS